MTTRLISPLDAAWLLLESGDTAMHVGCLMEFTKPADAGPDFHRRWVEKAKQDPHFASPFNLVPVRVPFGGPPVPAMRETDEIDLDHHVRLWGLPRPGGQRELGVLVSALQSQPLDIRRPLWELHIIDGLEGDRFAVFFKIHHSVIDGASAMRLIERMMSTDPDHRDAPPIWTVGRPAARPDASGGGPRRSWRNAPTIDGPLTIMKGIAGLVPAMWELVSGQVDGQSLRAPYTAAASPLRAALNGQRRLATQQFDLEALRALARTAGCTLNDLVLYLCGTALRSYLHELDELPPDSLTAGVPVDIREPGDERPGTAIGFLVAELGTNITDPLERLRGVSPRPERPRRT